MTSVTTTTTTTTTTRMARASARLAVCAGPAGCPHNRGDLTPRVRAAAPDLPTCVWCAGPADCPNDAGATRR